MGILPWDLRAVFSSPEPVRNPRLTVRCEYPDTSLKPTVGDIRPVAFLRHPNRDGGEGLVGLVYRRRDRELAHKMGAMTEAGTDPFLAPRWAARFVPSDRVVDGPVVEPDDEQLEVELLPEFQDVVGPLRVDEVPQVTAG